MKSLLLRGLLAGLIAGLLTGAVAFALGEPHVTTAVTIEESAPAVGDPDTINERTLLWLAALVLGLAAVGAAVYVAKALASQHYWTVRTASAIVTFLAIVTVGYLLLPTVNEVGEDFPATLLWQFRVSSLATQATLWLSLGLVYAYLTERAQRGPASPTTAPASTPGQAPTGTSRP